MGAKRRIKRKSVCRRLSVAAISLAFCVILIYYFTVSQDHSESLDKPMLSSRAVVIDGIGLTRPNPDFIRRVNETLVKAGFSVDVYIGDQVTMKLLDHDLGGYNLIILRVHSAIDEYGFLYIFSAETYDPLKYIKERIYGAYKEAYTFDRTEGLYFTLRADLLGSENGLKGSIIVLMGCNGTNSRHAIKKLFDRGVKAVIAWDGYVSLEYVDEVIPKLLEIVYIENRSYEDAVQKIMATIGPDPNYGSRLLYLANSST